MGVSNDKAWADTFAQIENAHARRMVRGQRITLATAQTTDEDTQEAWQRRIEAALPEVAVPGYWESLDAHCAQWAKDTSVSAFWAKVGELRSAWTNEFYQENGHELLAAEELPSFVGKGWNRIKSKCFHKRRENANPSCIEGIWMPNAPAVPKLNDLVRTRIQCTYLDGVEFLTNKLEELARSESLNPSRERKGNIRGYFAQHLYFDNHVVYKFGSVPTAVRISCEIQVATELSTKIWNGSHGIFEVTRETPDRPDGWQWDPKDLRFMAHQLGHMLHLVDGMLVQLREETDKLKGKK